VRRGALVVYIALLALALVSSRHPALVAVGCALALAAAALALFS
jgi:hypothetical protein